MTTRCMIFKELDGESGKFEGAAVGVYCHFDGYVKNNGVGEKLNTYYCNRKDAEAVIAGGSMMGLGESIEDTAYIDTKNPNIKKVEDIQDWVNFLIVNGTDLEYIYLYTLDDEWEVVKLGPESTGIFVNLRNALYK